jgi:uncharacterized membrane protein YjfL (UPF0719 family)
MDLMFSVISLLLQLFFGVIFSIVAIYLSLRFFDKMTGGIDELKELKKGNVAVGIIFVSLMLGIGILLSSGINEFGLIFNNVFENKYSFPLFLVAMVLAVIELIVVVLISVFVIYISINVLDRLTAGINELDELKKGNVAVALEIGGVIVVVSLMMVGAIQGIEQLPIFNPLNYISLLGL